MLYHTVVRRCKRNDIRAEWAQKALVGGRLDDCDGLWNGMGIEGLLMALTGSGIRDTIGVSAGTTTMGGLISHSVRKWANLLVVVVESSCDGSLHYVPEGGRRAWRRRSP